MTVPIPIHSLCRTTYNKPSIKDRNENTWNHKIPKVRDAFIKLKFLYSVVEQTAFIAPR